MHSDNAGPAWPFRQIFVAKRQIMNTLYKITQESRQEKPERVLLSQLHFPAKFKLATWHHA